MLDCDPRHPDYPDRLESARALKNRIFAALTSKRSPEFLDLLSARLFLATFECTGPDAAGTALAQVYLLIKAVLPAASAAFDQAHTHPPRPEGGTASNPRGDS